MTGTTFFYAAAIILSIPVSFGTSLLVKSTWSISYIYAALVVRSFFICLSVSGV